MICRGRKEGEWGTGNGTLGTLPEPWVGEKGAPPRRAGGQQQLAGVTLPSSEQQALLSSMPSSVRCPRGATALGDTLGPQS